MEKLVRDRRSPSLLEISHELKVSVTRVKVLLAQLEEAGIIERSRGVQRGIVIRDVTKSRELLTDIMDRLGWGVNGDAPHTPEPFPEEHLPRLRALRCKACRHGMRHRFRPRAGMGGEQIVPSTVSSRTAAICAFRAFSAGQNWLKPAGKLVPVAGIEPATFGLQNRCSTS